MAQFRMTIPKRVTAIKVPLSRSLITRDIAAHFMTIGPGVPDIRKEIADWLKRRHLRGIYTFSAGPASPTRWFVNYYFSDADTAFEFKMRWG